jgi:hypothetical protein
MWALLHLATTCSAQANATGPPPYFEWPTFVRWSDLEGSAWGDYFAAVYEQDRIPFEHFPLAVSSFWCGACESRPLLKQDLTRLCLRRMFYTDQLKTQDVDVPNNPPRCPGSGGQMARDGSYYTENNMYSPPNTAWIWHKPPYHAVESDDGWIEVIRPVPAS